MNEEMRFEEALSRLENIVKLLEEGEQPLDESLEIFEEGIKLYNKCLCKLEDFENKVSVIMKNQEGDLQKLKLEVERG